MLLSQSFHDLSTNHEKFRQSAGEENPNPTPQAYSKTSMSVSSLSSSSSPSSAATPPGLKQHCSNLEPCENGSYSKNENPFPMEQLFGKTETAESRPPRSDSCPSGIFADSPLNSNNVKPSNGSYNGFSSSEAYGSKLFDPNPSFDAQSAANMSHSNVPYVRKDSQDLSSAGDPTLLQQIGAASNRKSYDNITDKELRKKLKNRESAQAARDRKKAKMLSLERQVSELHERYRLVESENQELRIRIQRMEASAYWRMEKHETNGLPTDSSGILPFPVNAIGSLTHGPSSSDPSVYSRPAQYPNICGFGEYGHHSQPCVTAGPESTEESSLPSFGQMSLDAAEFHQSNFPPTVWNGDSIASLQNAQPQGNFANDASYSDTGSLIG